MDYMDNPTGRLLDLVAAAAALSDPAQLLTLLQTGHTAWCEGLAQVRTSVFAQCEGLDDAALSAWCQRAGAPWEQGQSRPEAVSGLAFAIWDASPSAMAYTALEERAAAFNICLLPE